MTRCTEELAAIILHQFNCEVASAVDYMLDNDVKNLENVITTQHRASRKNVPPVPGQPTEGNGVVSVLEVSETKVGCMCMP